VRAITIGLLALMVGCNSGSRGSRATAVAPTTSATTTPTTSSTPPPPPPPAPTLPASATLTRIGAPQGGLPAICDLEVFDGKLWLAESDNPLATFGAQVWTWDPTAGFTRVIDDPTSQGFLRARAIGGKLYVPDADPDGLSPGIIYIVDSAAAAPRRTSVDQHVHTFDVVSWNGGLFALGGLDTAESGVNRFDAALDRWTVFSRGPFSRLKYGGVLDASLIGTKRVIGTTDADIVSIDAAGTQTGLTLVTGEANVVCVEALRGALYLALGTPTGVSHVRLEAGGAVVPLTGISGAIVFDFVQHVDGNVYALGTDGQASSFVYGSTDGVAFTRLVTVPDLRFGIVAGNADGRPSIATFGGELYCGSSTDGALYRVD
jgi:hypothetical protein